MRKEFVYGLAVLFTAFWLAGCVKTHPPKPRVDNDPKVLIMYDNIGEWFDADVAEAGKAVAAGALAEGHRVMVFHRRSELSDIPGLGGSSGSVIYELVRDKSESAGYSARVLMQYDSGEMNDLSPEIIHSVVGKIRSLTPEANHYGLAFGSHGMGWIQKNYAGSFSRRRSAEPDPFAVLWEIPENPQTRYLAYDNTHRIDISEFAAALDEWEWDFIIFDDCFMASVEALYELRDLADYFIASPTEILQYGFPYDRVVERLFRDDWTNLAGVAADFVDSYRERTHTSCATVSVVKADELEALMQSVRAISVNQNGSNDINPGVAGIQFYEGLTRHVFFDLDEYMYHFSRSVSLYEVFRDQLARTVVFADHTEDFFTAYGTQRELPITHYSGLSVFIPWTGTVQMTPYYLQTEWHKAVYE